MADFKVTENDRIPVDLVIGNYYTCTWANNKNAYWKLVKLDKKLAYLEAPKSGNLIETHEANLRLLEKDAYEVAKERYERFEEPVYHDSDYALEDIFFANTCEMCGAEIADGKMFCSERCMNASLKD